MSSLKRKNESDNLMDFYGLKRQRRSIATKALLTTSSGTCGPQTKLSLRRPPPRSRSAELEEIQRSPDDNDSALQIKQLEERARKIQDEIIQISQKSSKTAKDINLLEKQSKDTDAEIDKVNANIEALNRKRMEMLSQTALTLEELDRTLELETHKEMVFKSHAEGSTEHISRIKATIEEFEADTLRLEADMQAKAQEDQAVDEAIELEKVRVREIIGVAFQREASRRTFVDELAEIEAKCKALLELKA
jgi:chromosome segregation ATPase